MFNGIHAWVITYFKCFVQDKDNDDDNKDDDEDDDDDDTQLRGLAAKSNGNFLRDMSLNYIFLMLIHSPNDSCLKPADSY